MTDVDWRRWAVEQAVMTGADPHRVIDVAHDMLLFVTAACEAASAQIIGDLDQAAGPLDA